MDQQPQQDNRNCNSKLSSTALSAALARHSQSSNWPAHDRPPHYYASQNSCNIKMISQPANQSHQSSQPQQQQQQANSFSAAIQRKLFGLLYIYAILIVSLYLTYAAYYFLQQHQYQQRQTNSGKRQASAQELRGGDLFAATTPDTTFGAAEQAINGQHSADSPSVSDSKLETKLHLLERYMELIAMDLQETKEKLKEREKCDCSQSCHFNGTRYEDRSSWQNQCDICTCQMGKISCQPKKCPPIQCDHFVTLPGQCCPTCMRQCKYNKMLYRHGEKFNPSKTSSTQEQPRNQTKVCQCLDGRIRCESAPATQRAASSNKTSGLVIQSATTAKGNPSQALAVTHSTPKQAPAAEAASNNRQVAVAAAMFSSSTSAHGSVDQLQKATDN